MFAASPKISDDDVASEVAKLVSYVIFLIAAAGLYVAAIGLPVSRWEPLGAGAFPKLVMGLLAALCVIAIALSARRLSRWGRPHGLAARIRAFIVAHRLVLLVFLAFGLYLAGLRTLGFSIATFLFLLVAQLIVAPRDRRTIVTGLVVAVIFSFGLNWLFAEGFTVFLPRGLLG
ncbi:tripartite tricarboxylate transporter TctB family protein [Aurantimonas marina]|uniref:tripartite tricarboxylate transporter TctB family protein n=1 Tax=Aurantimonas marina TaxID=2780508 RepID=UPI0019D23C97